MSNDCPAEPKAEQIAQLVKDRSRYMSNAARVRRQAENENAPYSRLWERAVIDCERQLTSLGWISPEMERRLVRIIKEGPRSQHSV